MQHQYRALNRPWRPSRLGHTARRTGRWWSEQWPRTSLLALNIYIYANIISHDWCFIRTDELIQFQWKQFCRNKKCSVFDLQLHTHLRFHQISFECKQLLAIEFWKREAGAGQENSRGFRYAKHLDPERSEALWDLRHRCGLMQNGHVAVELKGIGCSLLSHRKGHQSRRRERSVQIAWTLV